MPTLPSGKYQLKSLHEEIDLFDRKLAHLQKYETFPSEAERIASVDKLSARRNLLIKRAQQMIEEGIEFNESERPKSLRPETTAVTENAAMPVNEISVPTADSETPVVAIGPNPQPSPYAGTALDCQPDLQAYTKRKRKSA